MKKIASIVFMGMVLGLGVESANAAASTTTITISGGHGGVELSSRGNKNLIQ